jgi:hypothetical protein
MNTRLFLAFAAGLAFGQSPLEQRITRTLGATYEVRDRHGLPIVNVSKVKVFQWSESLKKYSPSFQCDIANVSGVSLGLDFRLTATVHEIGGEKMRILIKVNRCEQFCDFDAGAAIEHRSANLGDWFPGQKDFEKPYSSENFETIEFGLLEGWQSPEDLRLAAIEDAKAQGPPQQ